MTDPSSSLDICDDTETEQISDVLSSTDDPTCQQELLHGQSYPLECYVRPKNQSIMYKVGDKIEFRKQYGIKGLKIYDQAFRPGHVTKISEQGNQIKFVIKDSQGAHHYVGSREIRPFLECNRDW